jgi:hypothetical protein
MNRFARIAVTAGLACLVAGGGSAAAGPGDEPPGRMIAANAAAVVSERVPDAVCEQARAKSRERGPCAAEFVFAATAAAVATPAQLAGDGDLVSSGGRRLLDYVKTTPTGTIWTRTWSQEKRGLYYVNWWEKHSGRIYWHSGHVWSTGGTHGFTGNHTCDQGGGIGYDVRVTSCFTERISTNQINEWDYWKVYVFFQGFPISASHNMRIAAYGSGNIYGYG